MQINFAFNSTLQSSYTFNKIYGYSKYTATVNVTNYTALLILRIFALRASHVFHVESDHYDGKRKETNWKKELLDASSRYVLRCVAEG